MYEYTSIKSPFRYDLEVKRSQFITFVERCSSPEQFKQFLGRLKSQFPDARHHCYAHKLGHPNDSQSLGFSDDGEPNGTAGKPLLNVLTGKKDLGEVAVIVVRYFGGTKLGTGGLVRAYTEAAQTAISQAEKVKITPLSNLIINIPFELENKIRNFCQINNWQLSNSEYQNEFRATLSFPATLDPKEIAQELFNITNGKCITQFT